MRRLLYVGAAALFIVAIYFLFSALYVRSYRAGSVPRVPVGRDGVIFIVTDNVRADRTSLCGYARPTTPALKALAAAPGAVSTCRAYAPGSWTLPSHASYFTGLAAVQHLAHEYGGAVKDASGTRIITRTLKKEEVTLAERFRERGYQTALVAANPVVGAATGLSQGFWYGRAAKKFGELDAPELVDELKRVLREDLNPMGGPLFLTVNLADAHRPWKAIPADHDWLPRRKKLQYDNENDGERWKMFLEGRMSEPERASFLRHLTDVYDYGIERADGGVAAVLETVRAAGWCRDECRIVVTSDHGEFLGEHHLIDHGFYTWEENANVYVVAQGVEVTSLPEPFPGLAIHDLVLDGRLPDPLPRVEAWAWPHVRRAIHSSGKAFGSMSVARWTGLIKEMWLDGTYYRFDLAKDPHELGEAGGTPEAGFTDLKTLLELQSTRAGADEARMMEALEAAGYIE